MYSVSEAYSKAITADTREMPYRVKLAGAIVLDQTKVPSMILNESASGSNGVSIGTANSASLRLTLRDAETVDYSDVLVEPESGLVLPDGSIEWLPLGKFWVTNSSTNNDYRTVTLTCADGMYHLTGDYESELTYPTTIKAVVNEIVAKSGVSFEGLDSLPDVIIRRRPEKMTLREAIGYAAGCCGKNARFNRQGNLEFFWYEDTGVTIERKTQYLNGMTKLNDKPLNVNFEVVGKKETYVVNVVSDGSGGITATPGQGVLEGDTVVVSVNPFSGYELAIITAVAENGLSVTLYKNAEGGYTFVQPDSNVTVTAAFKEVGAVKFNLTVRAYDGGSIRTLNTKYNEGDKPIVFINFEEGYKLDRFATTPASVSLSRLGTNADGETLYEFEMPASDVTINAYFEEIEATYSLNNYVNTDGFTNTPGYIIASNLTTGEYVFDNGDIVQIHFMAESGYAFDRYESTVEMVRIDKDKYQFVMPASNVTITAYFKYADDESKTGKYSWLALPAYNPPPTEKPYWAVFYQHDPSKPTCQRFSLVWFDTWESRLNYDASYDDDLLYTIDISGYYSCGSQNMGHYPHAWDTSSWQGNGEDYLTLEEAILGEMWSGDATTYGIPCLIASNANLYNDDGSLVFQACSNAIQHNTEGYVIDGMDVRERGAFGYYKCPDTFNTPAPAANWMILNSDTYLLMNKNEDETYEKVRAGTRGLYVVWFDSIAVENVGKVLSDTGNDEDFFIASVTNGYYTRLCLENKTWATGNVIGSNQVIGLRNPLISERYTYGAVDLGNLTFNGLMVSSCNISGSGTLLRYKNDCKICDCETAASTFSLRKTLSSGVENVTLSYSNPLIYEKSVDSVSNLVQGVTYTPAKVKHRGNPALQVGDIVTVPDKDGVEHSVLIMQQTMTFGGGMNSEITAPGQTERQASFSANGPMTTQIKSEVRQSTAELERRLSANNALVFASLQRNIGATEAKISSIVEWQSEKGATKADLELTASELESSIGLVSKTLNENSKALAELTVKTNGHESSIGMLVENGKVKGSVLVEAINGDESVITLNSNRLVINSDYFKLDQEGRIKCTSGKIGEWEITDSGLFYEREGQEVTNYYTLDTYHKYSFDSNGLSCVYDNRDEGDEDWFHSEVLLKSGAITVTYMHEESAQVQGQGWVKPFITVVDNRGTYKLKVLEDSNGVPYLDITKS